MREVETTLLLEEHLSENLRKLDLLYLESRLPVLLEAKDFPEKNFKAQLNLLLTEEVHFRQERAIKMRIKLARFPVPKPSTVLISVSSRR